MNGLSFSTNSVAQNYFRENLKVATKEEQST